MMTNGSRGVVIGGVTFALALILAAGDASTAIAGAKADDANAGGDVDDQPPLPSNEGSAPSLPETKLDQAPEEPRRADELEQRVAELEEKLRLAASQTEAPNPLKIDGYIDFGFFVPTGNGGVGWQRDVGNTQFPQYSNYAWTFLGDILGTAVNTRGEAADLGDSPGINRFDSINSNGAPGFLVNEVNLRVSYQIADSAVVRTSVNFLPRTGNEFSLGDFFELDIAELEYVLTDDGNTSLFVGKTLPVFGIEYKERHSDERFGIVPSLIHRYTSGTQLGVKFRSKLFDEWLILAAAATNGSSSTEQFHFQSEVDQNTGKTLSGRVALSFPVGDWVEALSGDRLEIGGSGEWGVQDRAADNDGYSWFAGADLTYASADFQLKAQLIRGKAPGNPAQRVYELNLKHSGYVELDWLTFSFLGFLARAELREATVTLAQERIYLTRTWRLTGGTRIVFNSHATLKMEYVFNQEYGGIQSFDNDVFTTSLVLSY